MIRPKIEEKNGYIKFHLIGIGKHALDTTKDAERDFNIDMSKDELREIRNAIDYYLHFNYKGQKINTWD